MASMGDRSAAIVSRVAGLLADPTRSEILAALLGGRALSASELARAAGVAPSTVSGHLDRLLRASLVAVEPQGRHRYYRLADDRVARVLETLVGLDREGGSRSARAIHTGPADPEMRRARVCYDHLAGELGVWVYDRLLRAKALDLSAADAAANELALSAAGERLFDQLGIDVAALRAQRRCFARSCLDWSERRHHLAGALGAALLDHIRERRWARQVKGSRALVFSTLGEDALKRALSLG
jgi:DNA-binding transcriptional ArsR family regulator